MASTGWFFALASSQACSIQNLPNFTDFFLFQQKIFFDFFLLKKKLNLKFVGSFHSKSARYKCLKYFYGLKTQLIPYIAKSHAKRNFKSYCKLICLTNIPNFGGPLCEIKMLTYFSTKQVLPEFRQDWAWECLQTLHVLSKDTSLTLWHKISKIIFFHQFFILNYCEIIGKKLPP